MPTSPPKTPKRGSPGNGRNSWTHEQRVTLDILWSHPRKPSGSERGRVFNSIFKDHLVSCGIPDGLRSNTLDSQYGERKKSKKSSWASEWGRVCAVPKLDDVLRAELRVKIDRVLMDGNIVQVAGPSTPPTTPPGRSKTQHFSSRVTAEKRRVNASQRYRSDQLVTPGPSTRKRLATGPPTPIVFDDNEEDEDFEPGPKRARKTRSPVVEIPATQQTTALVRSNANVPKKSGKSPRVLGRGRPGANYEYIRFDGTTIWLFYHEWLETQQPLNTVSERAAHPQTGPALVFRYWDGKSHGL